MDKNFLNILILIAGLLLIFLGLAPLISRKYFEEIYRKIWKSTIEPMSESYTYVYNRYIRQIFPLLMGLTLTAYAFYGLFF